MLKSIKKFYLLFFCLTLPQLSSATEILTTVDEHRNVLTEVLGNAKERVIIVSPYITTYAFSSDDIISKIEEAQDRGVKVVVYTDNRLELKDGTLKPKALAGRKRLAEALSGLCVAQKVHAKVLIADDDDITIGSFNWLSALRDEANQYSNHEQSIRVTGASAEALIEKSIEGLENLEMIESEYSAFYKAYQRDFFPYLREGVMVPSKNYVALLGNFRNYFHVYDHLYVSILTEEMDDHGSTPDEQLQWLTKELLKIGIISQIHELAIRASFGAGTNSMDQH